MATDFFQRQTAARRSTTWLLFMFGVATILVVGSIMAVTALALMAGGPPEPGSSLGGDSFPWQVPVFVGIGTLVLILGGSLYKVVELRSGGGKLVAERLGGVRIYPNTTDPVERRLLNVVEEMAIASGTTVPPVFMLHEEQGINAFAAGYSPADAVLGVTRGCAEKLKREELQGVMAHEFSHILNGDMRIGIRVMGVLFGILLLGLVGQLLFRIVIYSGRGSRRNSDSGKVMMAMILISIVLIILGFIGTFIGNIIKAAISRQRERLADASGVQFTRNPFGLAGALKRIGAEAMGSRMIAPNASEASHIFFAEGVWKAMAGLWSSHPPLPERIRALDPGWDGKFPAISDVAAEIAREAGVSGGMHSSFVGNQQNEMPVNIVDHAIDHVGNPTMAHVEYATALLPLIPAGIIDAAREPYAARALVMCLLLNKEHEIRAQQLRDLGEIMSPDITKIVHRLIPHIDRLDVRARLPLVDIAIPALAAMSRPQFDAFIQAFESLAMADGQLDLFEWVLAQIVTRYLRPHFDPAPRTQVRFQSLDSLVGPCSVVLSAIAYAGNSDAVAQNAFAVAATRFRNLKLKLQSRESASLENLRHALAALSLSKSADRGQLVDACADAITADRHATLQEVEMLRGISALLDCPMPPLLVEPA